MSEEIKIKKCSKCEEVKPVSEFWKCKSLPSGLQSRCKDCLRKQYRMKNPIIVKVKLYPDGYKKCTKCGKVKAFKEFWKNKDCTDGYFSRCKVCMNKQKSDYRKKDKHKINHAIYYENNKERFAEYRRNNIDKFKKRDANYAKSNKDKIRKYQAEYRKNNKEKIAENNVEYRKNNKDKILLQLNNKLKNNLEFKLKKNLATRINRAIKEQYSEKAYSSIGLLGCTIQEARKHIEKQFQLGMTWDNHGIKGWHIDHRIPCSKFDLTNPEEQKDCFHFTNLQPLWAADNLKKADKILYLI